MARIDYRLDRQYATQGLLRVSVVAKALGVAAKTVNSWKTFPVKKINGVKYLTWLDVSANKHDVILLHNLPQTALAVYDKILNTPKAAIQVAKADDVLAKAKALATTVTLKDHLLVEEPQPVSLAVDDIALPSVTVEEVLTAPEPIEPGVLTIPAEYLHFYKKK
jgi:hypothetical protein